METPEIIKLLTDIRGHLRNLEESQDEGTTDIFQINGTFDSNGRYTHRIIGRQVEYSGKNYKVSCDRFAVSSFTPNVKTCINDKFYYDPGIGTYQSITVPQGVYDAANFSSKIQELIDDAGYTGSNISFSLEESTLLTKHTISNSYKVKWQSDTFYDRLGYELTSGELELTTSGYSTLTENIYPSTIVYISCNLVGNMGQNVDGKPTGIILDFINTFEVGSVINVEPTISTSYPLVSKEFNEIYFECFDDNRDPIDFAGTEFNLRLRIGRKFFFFFLTYKQKDLRFIK